MGFNTRMGTAHGIQHAPGYSPWDSTRAWVQPMGFNAPGYSPCDSTRAWVQPMGFNTRLDTDHVISWAAKHADHASQHAPGYSPWDSTRAWVQPKAHHAPVSRACPHKHGQLIKHNRTCTGTCARAYLGTSFRPAVHEHALDCAACVRASGFHVYNSITRINKVMISWEFLRHDLRMSSLQGTQHKSTQKLRSYRIQALLATTRTLGVMCPLITADNEGPRGKSLRACQSQPARSARRHRATRATTPGHHVHKRLNRA